MNPYLNYQFHITPLSPTHIGTGQSYEPTNYVIDGGLLHEFDTGEAVAAFSQEERKSLLTITGKRPDMQMIKSLQAYFYERRQRLVPWAFHRVPVPQSIANFYARSVGQTVQHEGQGADVINKLEIDRCAYNPTNRNPVLFGSSLKGAIRTAWLDHLNDKQKANEQKGDHQFQGRLLKYKKPDGRGLQLERDPLRLFQIADAMVSRVRAQGLTRVYLAVNRKKAAVMDANGQLRRAMGDNLYQMLECVPAWGYRAFSGQMNVQNLDLLGPLLVNDPRLPEKSMRWSLKKIASVCNKVYWPLLIAELALLKKRGYYDAEWANAIQAIAGLAKARMDAGNAFLLRVGRHSGAEAVTVSGTRSIRIMMGRGIDAIYESSPRTIWLAADAKDQQSGLLPFGWLLVEVYPQNENVQDWPELRQLCEQHAGEMHQFAEKVSAAEQQWEKLRETRKQEIAEEKLKAQAILQAEAAEAERINAESMRIANLSPEAQSVEALRAKIDASTRGRGKGHQLYQETTQRIQSSRNWTQQDKSLLDEVARRVFDHLGIKKDDYKKLLRVLQS